MNYAIWNLNNRPHRGKRRKKRKLASVLTSAVNGSIADSITDSIAGSIAGSIDSSVTSLETSSNFGASSNTRSNTRSNAAIDSSSTGSKIGIQSYSTKNQMDRKLNLLTCVLKNIERKFIRDDKKDDVKYIVRSIDIDDKFKDEKARKDLKCNDIKRSKESRSNESINNDWRWVFDSSRRCPWTIIFLFTFIIQLTYITKLEALEHSTRNLIRFTIDHHSTYFNDLYTTPNYNLFYNTNSLTTGNGHTKRMNDIESDAFLRTTKTSSDGGSTMRTSSTSKRTANGRTYTTASARTTRSSTRTINKLSRILEQNNAVQSELNENKIEKLSKINNRIEHIDHLVDVQPTATAATSTTITNSKLSSNINRLPTTRRTLNANKSTKKDEKHKSTNTNLTGNKKIQSIKFNNQNYQNKNTPSWFQKQPQKYQQIYKTDFKPIDFEFNQLENRTLKSNTIGHSDANKTTLMNFNVVNNVNSNQNLDNKFNKFNKLNKFNKFDNLENLDHFRTTARIFIPFKSTFRSTPTDLDILETIDYNEKIYLNKSIYHMTTKLPRIKKNLKDEQIYFTNHHFKQTTPLNLVKFSSTFNDSKDAQNADQYNQINQLNQTDSNSTRKNTQFSGNGIIYNSFNKNFSIDKNETLHDLSDLNANETVYDSPFLIWLGTYIAHPSYEKVIIILAQLVCLIFTIVGNVLVIISIFTYNPLRNVQNMFLVSLAVSDITVAVCILPLNMAYYLVEKWVFGMYLCMFWLTSDILCCTASILNLCAIAVDRYQAIHDPINYRMKRTTKRVLLTIAFVWILSAVTSIPPLLGWNDWPEEFTPETPCKLTSEKGFVVFSSSVSFYIPLVIMTIVYIKIYKSAKKRLRKRAQSTARTSLKKGTKKSPIIDHKPFEQQKYLVDGKLVEVSEGGQAAIIQNYLDKGILNKDNESKLYVQLTAQVSRTDEDNSNRITTQQQQQSQKSSSTGHLPVKSDSGTGSSTTAAVIRVTNLLGAIKSSRNLNEHRQRQYSVTEPNTSSSNDDQVVFDYTTVNEGQHSLCLVSGKQLNTIEFDPVSLPIASTFHKESKSRQKVKRQSTPEEASDSSGSLVDKEGEFSSNNVPQYEQQNLDNQQLTSQQQSISQQSIAKSFKNRFQHSIFSHHQPTSSSTPPTTLSVHYSSSQTSFSNSSSAFNQQQPQHTNKFSSFNLLRRYKSRFHRANNATCFSNFEASSHSRPSIGVVSATSTPEVTSPSGNSPKGEQSPYQLPDVKEEPTTKTIDRHYLSATFKSTTCSALSKIASDSSGKNNQKQLISSSLHTLNVLPTTIHRTKSEDASYGLLHAVSQKLLEEQQNLENDRKPRRKSLNQSRLSVGSIGVSLATGKDVKQQLRSSNSCLNVYSQSKLNVHRDSTTSNSNQKTSETTQKTSSSQTGALVLTSSTSGPPSSNVIEKEKTSQNSNISSAISECNQRCISPTSMLQPPNRRHHMSSEKHSKMTNLGSSDNINEKGTSSNSQRNHSSNSNYYSYTSTTSTSILTTSQMQIGHGSDPSAVINSASTGACSSFNQSFRHPSNAGEAFNGSHPSMVKQVWEQKQRISLTKERKAAQVLGIVMGAFVISWLPFFFVYTFGPFCTLLFEGETCNLSEFSQMIITWLGYINSTLNPVIYTIFNLDFRVAFKRIFMKCCCAGKFRQQQKLYQQQQQLKINKRKEHKKKKLLQQKQKQRQQKIEGDKDSFNDTSRKSSLKDDRKSSFKQQQAQNNNSVNKLEAAKKSKQDDENVSKKLDDLSSDKNVKPVVDSEKKPEIAKEQLPELTKQQTVVSNYDNLHHKATTVKSIPLKMEGSSKISSSIKKSKSETTNLTNQTSNFLIYKLEEEPTCSGNQSSKLDFNNNSNNEQSNVPATKLPDIILNTNLKQLENNPDKCYFQIDV